MKCLCVIAMWMCSVGLVRAADTALVVLARQHSDLSESFPDRPYGDGDTSFGLFVDLFDGAGAWRIGANFSDDVTGRVGIDQVITPEVGLLATDRIWEAGIAALIDYVETEDASDWGDVYFQAHFGINLSLTPRLTAGIQAGYPFEGFDGLSDFDLDLVEYAGVVRFRF